MTNNEDARWCATGLLRMDTFTEYQRKHLLAAAAHLDRLVAENEAKDALLRQAVEALEGLFGEPDQWTGAGAGGVHVWNLGGSDAPRKAIAALRERLK